LADEFRMASLFPPNQQRPKVSMLTLALTYACRDIFVNPYFSRALMCTEMGTESGSGSEVPLVLE